uniref:Uncharacterized protein n=1 Tax=Strongyloides papillosus TaxID=174720 RepID=A0A0N5BAP5_STREA
MMGMGGYGMGMMDPMMMSGMGGGMMPGMMPGMYGGNTMGMQGIDSDSFGQGGFRHSMHTGKKDSDGDGIPDDMDPEPLRPQSSTGKTVFEILIKFFCKFLALNRQGTNGTQNSGTNRWKSAGQQGIKINYYNVFKHSFYLILVIAKNRLRSSLNGTGKKI